MTPILPSKPRKRGRPKGTGLDHSEALALVGEAICQRKFSRVAPAARYVKEKYPKSVFCSWSHLARLYRASRVKWERAYFDKLEALRDPDYHNAHPVSLRDVMTAHVVKHWKEPERPWIVDGIEMPLHIPIERWFYDELRAAHLALGGKDYDPIPF